MVPLVLADLEQRHDQPFDGLRLIPTVRIRLIVEEGACDLVVGSSGASLAEVSDEPPAAVVRAPARVTRAWLTDPREMLGYAISEGLAHLDGDVFLLSMVEGVLSATLPFGVSDAG